MGTVPDMAIAAFKDLCIDAVRPDVLGQFWATTLGLDFALQEGGDGVLTGPTDQHKIWVNAVPEPKTVKQRVHLDVHVEAVADLEALGARVQDRSSTYPWDVMRDPEGGEFCAFVRSERHDYRLYEVVVDSADGEAMAHWWADVFGASLCDDEHKRWWSINEVVGMPFEWMVFVPVPEPKRVKNRIHWDVEADDVQPLLDAGATLLRPKGDGGIKWHILADPEGNEFCVFTP